jgi:TonB family protein
MTAERADNWRDLALGSILTSPFLLFSLGFHLLMAFALSHLGWIVHTEKPNLSIPISLVEFGYGNSLDKSIGSGRGPGGPQTLPKLGARAAVQEARGKVAARGVEEPSADAGPASIPNAVEPTLPGPKAIADAPTRAPRQNETSPDSLVQLPTKGSSPNLSSVSPAVAQPRGAGVKEAGTGEDVRALKEGSEIPGALRGTGAGLGPYGVPGGVRDGKGIAGGGTGTGLGGGSATGLRGKFNAEYGEYLKTIEKRVYAVWRYPDAASGVQKVSVRFTVDRAGKLTQVEVVESTDPRINASALEAMKKASPFPPIPESLRDLADEPLIIRFTVAVRMRG